ncbi:hypothetical protein SNOG_12523 [Parastagonospora nodorum SN15]|uniref:Uncharacterized protein n=1 Tax=Phaeosphaeria nodorum (strain SN15 / ATCC MYA-4574 / FGSC 10173) TaxID=321614 RepID=Q0U6U1_PHANO|nr:hypothetical protein SNOG_12523 [Parastagonospora nodorum SN15]EAT80336.1 hypothetical protein SNOG_12523 [Parastagonospora nodorum SN15]
MTTYTTAMERGSIVQCDMEAPTRSSWYRQNASGIRWFAYVNGV